ncbi:putative D-lactate dehydrogenase [Caenibius tardaugens NBRC 16725]|uniref:D-lactate dehydrogenase (cytochrome) n=1 Tax=Caenibius tardaugens NBRC 16725 TaxID=1219035 RepID=U3A1Y9_9SPHN|nr:FAD-linked oxidase C-terminal domain-containing protein [Caenibius tardaugens]AZI36145.1 FAD-binding protein [Caenibius tardaugens NBRC 16725]GAD48768.1 putative D-lactate dehydrogenase [Caenibius tardaugens NBRC 16725]
MMGEVAATTGLALDGLRAMFGDRFSDRHAVREHHGRAETFFPAMLPDAVIYPHSTEEVAAAVRHCAAHQIPIIPYGVGTSLEGHFLALHGGVCIDLSQMNHLLRVSEEDLDCTVEPGVTRKQLNEELRHTGLFFPIDPGADATIGGMAATRASGTNAVRYGTMRQNVLGLTVVLPDGRIIHTGGRARKSSAGYDLTGLFVGSEGTLGIITEVTVRLYGQPEAISSGVCEFETLRGAVDTVIQTIQLGIPVARIELVDELQIRAVNQYSGTKLAERPTLFLEFHGTPAGVAEQSTQFGEIAAAQGGDGFRWTTNTEERTALWEARHKALYADMALRPGGTAISTDVCVPISRLCECITQTRAAVDASGLIGPIVGHVGDGNFHVVLVFDPESADEVAKVKALSEQIVELALAHGGTCTGEHGIGMGKKGYLIEEHGEAVDVMRAIKRAIDPAGIMNPGKVFDA